MNSKRPLRWPNLLEQLTIAVIISALGWILNTTWTTYKAPSERALIVVGAIVTLATIVILYERFRAEQIVVAFTEAEYENILTELARKHRGSIAWETKTTIWADLPEAYSGRLTAKIEGLKSGRITNIRYIVHLGYWRQYVREDLSIGSFSALDLYRTKLETFLRHVENYEYCPPARVQIIVGEIDQPGPAHRFGIYKSPNTTSLVFGYDVSMGKEALPRLAIRGHSELVRYYQNLFDQQWEIYVDRVISHPDFPMSLPFHEAIRKVLINRLRDEIGWIDSVSEKQDSELTSVTQLRHAGRLLEEGKSVTLSCPQKVCISGDYEDMHDDGLTLTGAVNIRPRLTIRRSSEKRSSVHIHYPDGKINESSSNGWSLVEAFQKRLNQLKECYVVDIFPTELMGVGLGSSGAASILLASAIALAENRVISIRELIYEAHYLETKLASCPCGPQDHVAAALGGLRLIEYPSLRQNQVPYLSIWNELTFWMASERRQAKKIIPKIVDGHTRIMWDLKREITRNIANSFSSSSLPDIIEAVRNEYTIQKQLQMLTDLQLNAVELVMSRGGAAKVSGAGGGGILLVVMPKKEHLPSIQASLREMGLSEILLSIDAQGLTVETAGLI